MERGANTVLISARQEVSDISMVIRSTMFSSQEYRANRIDRVMLAVLYLHL